MLERFRMLDLGRRLPGPFTSHVLADLGMDVVKIEEILPRYGVGRDSFTPFDPSPAEEVRASAYNEVARNKRSVALNLVDPALRPESQDVFYRLVEHADVILEGYRPGAVKWMGIDYETVSKINPRVVYCSVSAYGQDGPYALRGGHGNQFFAVSGLVDVMSRGGDEPAGPSIAIADLAAGFYAANCIQAALWEREKSGLGQYIDVSLTGAAMSLAVARPQRPGLGQESRAMRRRGDAGLGTLKCRDGLYLSTGNSELPFWINFCGAIGHEEYIPLRDTDDEPAFVAMVQAVRAQFLTKDRDEWIDILVKADTVVGPLNMNLEEAYEDPQMQHIGMSWDLQHPTEGTVRQIGFPVRFSRTAVEFQRWAPLLGEHTREVLAEAGYDDVMQAALEAKGIIKHWKGT